MPSLLNPQNHPFIFASVFAVLLGISINWPWRPLILSLLFAPAAPIVLNERTNVSYRGTSLKGVEQFQNIFYAEDTSGVNRFAPPVPHTPPPGTVIDATAPGAVCPQGMGGAPLPLASPITNVSENCLSIRITRPASVKLSSKLPVMVWIHGGGAALGAASDQLYEPEGLIRQSMANSQPIIFVGMNYRLGIFGFAASKALRDAKHGNAGLRDQRAAFEWVKENIAAFGGDPENVTAIGQSVGASAIGLHLTSYAGKQGVPFHKAIMISGASGLNFNIKSNVVSSNTATVARSLDCIEDPDSSATLACLRNAPLDKLMNISVTLARELRPPFGELSFYPSFDGDYIPDRPSVLLRKGGFAKGVPIIASWTSNDGAWYASPTTTDDATVIASFTTFIVGLTEASLKRLLALYRLSDFETKVQPGEETTAQYYRAAQINRDLWFTCPVLDFTWQYAKQGGGALHAANVCLYEMNQTKFEPIWTYMGVPHWHVGHLSDISYMLNLDVAGGGDNSPSQQHLSSLVSGSAAAFAYTGDPTKSEAQVLRNWPTAWSGCGGKDAINAQFPQRMNVYVIGGPHGVGVAEVAKGEGEQGQNARERAVGRERLFERCEFINSILDEIGV